MKKYLIAGTAALTMFASVLLAQSITVPQAVKTAFAQKYPEAVKQVNWEKENGNYEANWGGKSGEDNSAMYSPTGKFLEIAKAISVKELPAASVSYVNSHYKGHTISEAALVTDAKGKVTYEAEVAHKDVVFDQQGNFVKTETE